MLEVIFPLCLLHKSVRPLGFLVSAFDFKRHTFCSVVGCEAIVFSFVVGQLILEVASSAEKVGVVGVPSILVVAVLVVSKSWTLWNRLGNYYYAVSLIF